MSGLERSLSAYLPEGPEADAVLRYYILAAAHNPGLSEKMEMLMLDLLESPDCSEDTQKVIFYLIRQQRNEFLLLELMTLKRIIEKVFSWQCKSRGLQLIGTCLNMMEARDLADLYESRDMQTLFSL